MGRVQDSWGFSAPALGTWQQPAPGAWPIPGTQGFPTVQAWAGVVCGSQPEKGVPQGSPMRKALQGPCSAAIRSQTERGMSTPQACHLASGASGLGAARGLKMPRPRSSELFKTCIYNRSGKSGPVPESLLLP